MRPEHVEKIRRIPKPFIFVLLAALLVFSYFLAFSEAIPIEMWHLKDGYSIYHMSNAAGILIRFILGVTALAWLLVIFSLTPSKKDVFERYRAEDFSCICMSYTSEICH